MIEPTGPIEFDNRSCRRTFLGCIGCDLQGAVEYAQVLSPACIRVEDLHLKRRLVWQRSCTTSEGDWVKVLIYKGWTRPQVRENAFAFLQLYNVNERLARREFNADSYVHGCAYDRVINTMHALTFWPRPTTLPQTGT